MTVECYLNGRGLRHTVFMGYKALRFAPPRSGTYLYLKHGKAFSARYDHDDTEYGRGNTVEKQMHQSAVFLTESILHILQLLELVITGDTQVEGINTEE